MGEQRELNDLMAWNADVTRMPYRMHSNYLQRQYLGNDDLAEGRYRVGGKPVAIAGIEVPMFIVRNGTRPRRALAFRVQDALAQ